MSHVHTARLLTWDDFESFPDDGNRHEIVAGVHVVSPPPRVRHQTASKRLHYQLYVAIELAGLGQVFYAPIGLEVSPIDILQPDLLVVLGGPDDPRLQELKILGSPDLVVEILSPSTARMDRQGKKARYELAGVREYWIVDAANCVLEQWALRDGRYLLLGEHRDTVALDVLPSVSVDLTRVW